MVIVSDMPLANTVELIAGIVTVPPPVTLENITPPMSVEATVGDVVTVRLGTVVLSAPEAIARLFPNVTAVGWLEELVATKAALAGTAPPLILTTLVAQEPAELVASPVRAGVAAHGSAVAFVSTKADGVPRAGVVRVGDVAKTLFPVPVAPVAVTPPIEILVPKVCKAEKVCARLVSAIVPVLAGRLAVTVPKAPGTGCKVSTPEVAFPMATLPAVPLTPSVSAPAVAVKLAPPATVVAAV